MDVHITDQKLQANNTLDNVYAKSVILEGELSLAEMQVAFSKNDGSFFNNL